MANFLDNFKRLYSLDRQICYKAVLEKKDWMFRKLYIPITFICEEDKDNKKIYPELYALLDSSFYFKNLGYSSELFKNIDFLKAMEIINEFNKDYAYLNLLEKLDYEFDKDCFYCEINTYKMEDKVYKELFANFYPTTSNVDDLELHYEKDDLMELIKLPMYQKEGFVLILHKSNLLNNRYYLPIISSLHYSKSRLNEEKIKTIKEIGKKLDVEVIEDD